MVWYHYILLAAAGFVVLKDLLILGQVLIASKKIKKAGRDEIRSLIRDELHKINESSDEYATYVAHQAIEEAINDKIEKTDLIQAIVAKVNSLQINE